MQRRGRRRVPAPWRERGGVGVQDGEVSTVQLTRRRQRGDGVTGEGELVSGRRRRDTDVVDRKLTAPRRGREMATPRRGQRGFGAIDDQPRYRGGDFSFVDNVATDSNVPALMAPRRQRGAGVADNFASAPQRGRGCSGAFLHVLVKRASLRASPSLSTDTLLCAPLSSFGNPVQVI